MFQITVNNKIYISKNLNCNYKSIWTIFIHNFDRVVRIRMTVIYKKKEKNKNDSLLLFFSTRKFSMDQYSFIYIAWRGVDLTI